MALCGVHSRLDQRLMNFKLDKLPTEMGTTEFEKENAIAEGGKVVITFDGIPNDSSYTKEVRCSLCVTGFISDDSVFSASLQHHNPGDQVDHRCGERRCG